MAALSYLIFCVPVFFFVLSGWYALQYKRLLHSGKVPVIIDVGQKRNLFLSLALLSAAVIIFAIVY